GSFKLRFNQSRFERKEGDKKNEERVWAKVVEQGEGSDHRSFKAALVKATGKQKIEEVEEVLQVEVDRSILKELERSFVGKLALKVEVQRIKTTLYMEGFAHISVTDMGGDMVLISSPKM
ncbi:hypothetical protein A2U01_0061630, partial [Trifolium medium]|nr:hypothetical protein [Trifolium medium]